MHFKFIINSKSTIIPVVCLRFSFRHDIDCILFPPILADIRLDQHEHSYLEESTIKFCESKFKIKRFIASAMAFIFHVRFDGVHENTVA